MIKNKIISYRLHHVSLDGYDKEYEFDISHGIDSEKLIYHLSSSKLVQLLLLRYLGYEYKEIMTIMNLKSQAEYYMYWTKLRREVERFSDNLYN